MARLKAGFVHLSTHALERWRLRVSEDTKKKEIIRRIRGRIAFELKNGAEVNPSGALEIEIRPGVWAICFPSFVGGWEVATILREGWDEGMEERAIYGGNGNERHRLREAIKYFEKAITESDEIINDCSADMKVQLLEQKEHFVVALSVMRENSENKKAQ